MSIPSLNEIKTLTDHDRTSFCPSPTITRSIASGNVMFVFSIIQVNIEDDVISISSIVADVVSIAVVDISFVIVEGGEG